MAMDSKNKGKLAKLKMPEKKKPEDELDLSGLDEGSDYPMEDSEAPEGSPEEESMESPEEEKSEGSDQLAEVPDEDLMAEVEKRGLMKQLDSKNKNPMEDDSSDEEQYS